MLAHLQGTIFNASKIASDLGVSGRTVGRSLELMVDLFLVRRLQPWFANVGKRLTNSPKTYVRDSGVVHTLQGILDHASLLGHPIVVASRRASLSRR